jgi:hypothetical protein
MSASTLLHQCWECLCAEVVGRALAINHIDEGVLAHVVDAGAPPLDSTEGPVRRVTLTYNLEDYENELPN